MTEQEVWDYITEEGHENVISVEFVDEFDCFGVTRELWKARTTDGVWWVLNQPINLYRCLEDEDAPHTPAFSDPDAVMTFHVGFTARLMSGGKL